MRLLLTLPCVVAAAAILGACSDQPDPLMEPSSLSEASAAAIRANLEAAPDSSWIVTFDRDRVPDGRAQALGMTERAGGQLGLVFPGNAGFSAKLPPRAVEALRRHPHVQVVSPNGRVALHHHTTQSNAPWGLDRISKRQQTSMDATYSYIGNGSGVDIYVIDTGVEDHEELDNVEVERIPLFGRDGTDCAPNDEGHGTPVASVAAGVSTGVAKGAVIWSIDAFCENDQIDNGITALHWIRVNHPVGQPAVVNLSWGDQQPRSGGSPGGDEDCPPGEMCLPQSQNFLPRANPSLDSAVSSLIARGISVVVSAGNANVNACDGSPGRVPEAITVAASDQNDSRWYDHSQYASNYGSCVDIFAPGHLIESASKDGGTTTLSGTSFAAPLVSGVVAQYLEEDPGLSPASIVTRLLSHSTRGAGLIANKGSGSPDRLLFSLPKLAVNVVSPTVLGSGQYQWTANAEGGTGHFTYEWSRRWVYPDGYRSPWHTLGIGSQQSVTVNSWDPRFEIRVKATSSDQTATWSEEVGGHCGGPGQPVCIESVPVALDR